MNVTEFVQAVKRQYGDEADIYITNSDIYQWIYEAELQVIRDTENNETTLTTNVFPTTLATPNNNAVHVRRCTYNNIPLTYITQQELDALQLTQLDTGGEPVYWYRFSPTQWTVYPLPPTAALVKFYCIVIPTLMAGAPSANFFVTQTPFHPDMIHYVVARAHNKNRNYTAEQISMAMWQKTLAGRQGVGSKAIDYRIDDPSDFARFQ